MAEATTSSAKISPHCSKGLLEVMMMEPLGEKAVTGDLAHLFFDSDEASLRQFREARTVLGNELFGSGLNGCVRSRVHLRLEELEFGKQIRKTIKGSAGNEVCLLRSPFSCLLLLVHGGGSIPIK